jgi:trehalose 6-phosphate phosphatase
MSPLFAEENRNLLAQLAWSRVLLAFDFDGTLAPIVKDRDGAWMRQRTHELFIGVCDLYPCAVISGRSQADVASRLKPARVKYVVGNHGLEPGANKPEFEADVARSLPLLTTELAGEPGVDIEDKRYSLAIHYRRARHRRSARQAILDAVNALPMPMRVVGGKCVVNVIPAGAPSKGDALLALRDAERADTALYVGDDVTDEDVFQLDQPGRLVSIRVRESAFSAASYFIPHQRDIDRLLSQLVKLRQQVKAG